ncbi:hypothetical protein Cni_G09562 [Canna indica]|uniref:Uncharacterized protein n=1 Tax=Canna indica TaxID=4628 RepID=A0AAQ3K2K0_9LILI|nr:hypothetical protein Cni_G09562 [Canna indica]
MKQPLGEENEEQGRRYLATALPHHPVADKPLPSISSPIHHHALSHLVAYGHVSAATHLAKMAAGSASSFAASSISKHTLGPPSCSPLLWTAWKLDILVKEGFRSLPLFFHLEDIHSPNEERRVGRSCSGSDWSGRKRAVEEGINGVGERRGGLMKGRRGLMESAQAD